MSESTAQDVKIELSQAHDVLKESLDRHKLRGEMMLRLLSAHMSIDELDRSMFKIVEAYVGASDRALQQQFDTISEIIEALMKADLKVKQPE